MLNNYDPIATNYDWISRIIFRQNLVLAQTCLLKYIPPGSKILIVGGGTGWILEEITKTHSSGLSITYIEISQKMIELAKKCNAGQNQISFVNADIEKYITQDKFDIIFTAFLFDNFGPEKINDIFEKLETLLNLDGKWLFADFYIDKKSNRLWPKLLLKAMLLFFRFVCNIEARKLIPMHLIFTAYNFKEIAVYHHFKGFIKSSVYVKT